MKLKLTSKGNVKITLSNEQADHLKRILDYSSLHGEEDPDYRAREETSWYLWGLIKNGSNEQHTS